MTTKQIDEYSINSLQDTAKGIPEDKERERLEEVKYTYEYRYCSGYGVSTLICVCETDPVDKINLETERQHCYFATTDVSKMCNGWRRNMVFWWYMTNTYNICGKGHREEQPVCLKYAIRKAYPLDDGWYTGYKSQLVKTCQPKQHQ